MGVVVVAPNVLDHSDHNRRSCLGISLVAIGVGLEGAGIDDSFVIYQLVPFVLGIGSQTVVFRFPDDLISFGDLNLSWFGKGSFYFVLDILTHDVVIQLGVSFTVESEASDFALHLSLISSIPVVLGMYSMYSMYSSSSNSEAKSPR